MLRGGRVIAELKRRSPSGGSLRADLDVGAVAAAYAGAGAAAISVLTDGADFGGSPADLEAVRAAVEIPVLRKDFTVDPVQIAESRVLGADWVLLIVAVLEGGALDECLEAVRRAGAQALVEVHDERQVERALTAGAICVGINNRDLRSLRTDLGTFCPAAPAAPGRGGERRRVRGAQRRRRRPPGGGGGRRGAGRRGADASPRPGCPLRRAGGRRGRGGGGAATVRGRGAAVIVKVCGVRTPEIADCAVEAGADWVGVVLEPRSPRHADAAAVDAVRTALAGRADLIGVMVEPTAERCAGLARHHRLDAVQLHGRVEPWLVEEVDVPVIRAVNPAAGGRAFTADWWPDCLLLLDSPPAGAGTLPGGTGRLVDLETAAEVAAHRPIILAGGLTPDNVAAAIERVRPHGVDASSGLEFEPRGQGPRQGPRLRDRGPRGVHDAARARGGGHRSGRRHPRRRGRSMTAAGRFGIYGGAYVPETLVPAVEELEAAMTEALADPAFVAELDSWLRDYAGRPTPLTLARRLTADCAGAEIWLKREDLVHTGAHKLNNALGQVLLARRMGKTRIIAETGAGQHGVAVATVCACFGLECVVYMGREDTRRQAVNVYRMGLLGAEVRPVDSGSRTLKDATNEAIRDWVTNVQNTHYVIGWVVGPHPYPTLVRRFQRVIGDEARAEALRRWGALPDSVVACVGGGSNAIGIFTAFIEDEDVELLGVEAAGRGIGTGEHAASLVAGRPGVLHGRTATCSRTRTARCARRIRSRRGSTTPGSAPSTPRSATRSGPATSSAPTRRRCAPSTGSAGWRGSSPRSSPATPWRWRSAGPASSARGTGCWSA